MSTVLLLTRTGETAAEILPSLSLLDHTVRVAPASPGSVPPAASPGAGSRPGPAGQGQAAAVPDAVLVDARRDLVRARDLLRQLGATGIPLIAVIGEGAWAAVGADWGADEVILDSAGPGEVEARLRLAISRASLAARGTPAARHAAAGRRAPAARPGEVRSGELVIDEATYSARIGGIALDLTFKEFELLKYLAQHPRRVFTRSQLLQEVWGYDYFGGTRTVDVHVRRLRAKLGTENEGLIGTVRNVGYRFVPAATERQRDAGGGQSELDGRPGMGGRREPTPGRDGTSGPGPQAAAAGDGGAGAGRVRERR